MNRDFANTLEAIANLLYLVRASLDDSAKADTYLSMAEDIVQSAVKHIEQDLEHS
jgi:hypothetical protein